MKILPDNSVWIESLSSSRQTGREKNFLYQLIKNDEQIYLTGFILQQILSGIRDEKSFTEIEGILRNIAYIEPEKEDYIYAAKLKRILKKFRFDPIQLLTAALAIHHDLFLVTAKSDYYYIAKATNLKILGFADYIKMKGSLGNEEQMDSSFKEIALRRKNMEFLKLDHISVPYFALDNKTRRKDNVVTDIHLNIKKGEILGILGPTGSGKSVLLRAIAGVIFPIDGEVYLDGKAVTDKKPHQRNMSMVFQDYVLYPFLSAKGNIKFPVLNRKLNNPYKVDPDARVDEIAEMLELTKQDILERQPKNISGGEKQRVALGKAIAVLPDVILLDEPLSNIEENFRHLTRHSLRKLLKENNITAIYVTHNQTEIAEVADRIAVMFQGHIEQVDTYQNLYHDPKRFFVAQFIGKETTNFLTKEEVRYITQGEIPYTLTIRPDECLFGNQENIKDAIRIEGPVSMIEKFISDKKKVAFIERERKGYDNFFGIELPLEHPVKQYDQITITIPMDRAKFFDEDGDRIYNLW